MIQDLSSIKIGPIWNSGRGASFHEEINASLSLPEPVLLTSPITAEIMLVRMKGGVTVVITDLDTSMTMVCARCLESYQQKITIANMEAHFYEVVPKKNSDLSEHFPIRMRDMSIDLTEALRQEIILHFPMIPVCSKRCKGLCSECKVNLNHDRHKQNCHYQESVALLREKADHTRPFANLKDLFNQ